MAILPSVTSTAENAASCTVATLNPAHCASVGLKLSDGAVAWVAAGASPGESRPLRTR